MKALSVRQPWAWSIIHGGKTIENRVWREGNPGLRVRGRVLIHAAKHMNQYEYREFCALAPEGAPRPRPADLQFGGVIGDVDIVSVIGSAAEAEPADAPWFSGPYGLVLRAPRPRVFMPFVGQLGFFNVPDELLNHWKPLGEVIKTMLAERRTEG